MRKLLGSFDAKVPAADVLDALVQRAMEEDAAFDDRSTLPLPGRSRTVKAKVLAREGGVLAGVAVFARVFETLAPGECRVGGRSDGDRFAASDVVLTVEGPAGALLSGERTALNFLQRLSGIATATRRAVDAAGGRLAVCDTRKTTPGLRALEKWAVVVGGGTSHRWSLADMVMLKENHIALAGGIGAAVAAVRADAKSARLPITVEARSFDEAMEAAKLHVDRILLDNMTTEEIRRTAAALGPRGTRPELEASGGIRAERLAELADAGIDLVSLGALTHSAKAIDFSLLLEGA
ncbi:MAG: carboxylating nicotinate-nucleotide diphosphorylase [Candidatus Eiseniibacteriota bacterium]